MTTTAPPLTPRTHLRPRARKAWLVAHVGASGALLGVEWVMIVAGLVARGSSPATAHGLYHLMRVLVFAGGAPMALITLASGLVLSLRTHWGVFRHTWVWVKLVLLVAVVGFGVAVVGAWIKDLEAGDMRPQIWQIVGAGGQFVALLVAVGLSVLKPGARRS